MCVSEATCIGQGAWASWIDGCGSFFGGTPSGWNEVKNECSLRHTQTFGAFARHVKMSRTFKEKELPIQVRDPILTSTKENGQSPTQGSEKDTKVSSGVLGSMLLREYHSGYAYLVVGIVGLGM